MKAEVAGQPDTYKLADFSVFPTSTNLDYDANGSLLTLPGGTAAPPSSLEWNAEGRLASATNSTSTNNFYYDDYGRRIAKVEDGSLTLYLWDGMNIIGTAAEDADLAKYYTRGVGIAGDVGTLVAVHHFGDSSSDLLHNNHRGDVVLATDDSGNVTGQYDYTPFGELMSSSGVYVARFGFSSKERDASDLVYFGFRYFSPQLNQFVSPDPIQEEGGANLYAFCGNNPVNDVDFFGQSYIDFNVSGGYWVGVTGGVVINTSGIYSYFGGGIVTPGAGGSVMASFQNPSRGWNVGVQGQGGPAGHVGYSFGDGGGAFSEFGLGGPPGASLAGYYMWEIPWEDIWELLLKYLLKPKEDPCP